MTKDNITIDMLEKIASGDWLPSSVIPGERKLAEMYGVSRAMVRGVIEELIADGYLYRIKSIGTFVHKKGSGKLNLGVLNQTGNEGITAIVKSQGIRVSNRVLTNGMICGNRFFASKLQISVDEPVFVLHRIRFGNGETLAVEYTYINARYFDDILDVNFRSVSLYDYMESKNHLPVTFHQRFRTLLAPKKECEHLGIKQGTPIFYYEFIGRDSEENIVEYTESYSRADKTEYRFTAG